MMKKILLLIPFAFAFTLMGCDDVRVSYGARWGVDRVYYDYGRYYGPNYRYRNVYFRDRMHHRQRSWRNHNDRYWGGQPGWGRSGRRHFESTLLASGPVLTAEDRQAYRDAGRIYGLSERASTVMLESLNRAAVGDFGGLRAIGLSKEGLAEAKRKDGRLSATELDNLGRALGVSPQKADNLIRSFLEKR